MSAKWFLQHCYGGRMEKSYVTNSFMENTGDVLAECEMAADQADRV